MEDMQANPPSSSPTHAAISSQCPPRRSRQARWGKVVAAVLVEGAARYDVALLSSSPRSRCPFISLPAVTVEGARTYFCSMEDTVRA
jgi:hypothetical protein